jgi:hypothetical protein
MLHIFLLLYCQVQIGDLCEPCPIISFKIACCLHNYLLEKAQEKCVIFSSHFCRFSHKIYVLSYAVVCPLTRSEGPAVSNVVKESL